LYVSLPCAPSFVRPVVCAPRRLCAPSFVRFVVPALLTAGLLLAAPDAHAGTYVWQTKDANGNITAQSPVYSGGTFTYTGNARGNNPGGQLLPFAFNSADGYYEDSIGNGCVPDAQGKATTCSTTLTGSPLTVTFIWQPAYPGEPPPASVIVSQNGYASGHTAYSAGNCVITYMCNDGLGGSITGDGICKDTKWSVQSPSGDGSVSLSCTSSSAFTGNSGTVGWYGAPPCANGIVSLGYSANVYPVTVSLIGTTKDSNSQDNILVGQSCTAFLSGIPSGCTVSNYQWGITGTTFQTWQSQTPAIGNDPANLDASYYVPGPGSLTQSRPRWYWNDRLSANDGVPAPETVSCTATVTPPAGQGAAFTVTATKPVSVFKPIWIGTGIGGYSKVSVPSSQTSFFLWAGPTAPQAANGLRGGMNFAAAVASPNPTLFGAGSLELVQLVTPDRSVSTENGDYTYSENGQEGLDTQYPYGWYVGAPNYQEYDDPGMPLQDYIVSLAKMSDQFQTYLLYFPPSSTQCVPLATFTWSTNGTAVLPNSTGTWSSYVRQYGSDTAGTVTPSGNTATFLPSNVFPEWTQINGTGTFGLTAPVDGGTFREVNLMPNNQRNISHNTRKVADYQPLAKSVPQQHRRSGAKHFAPMMKLHF